MPTLAVLLLLLGSRLALAPALAHALAHAEPTAPLSAAAPEAEAALLNLTLTPYLKKLLLWDDAAAAWRVQRPEETANLLAPVLVLHMWADYCKPCVEELPVLRSFAAQMKADHAGKVSFLYISLARSPSDMRAFLLKHSDIVPKGPQYSDVSLQAELERHLPNPLPLPATLVLDQHQRIHAAILGSFIHRRTELARVITTLSAATPPSSSAP